MLYKTILCINFFKQNKKLVLELISSENTIISNLNYNLNYYIICVQKKRCLQIINSHIQTLNNIDFKLRLLYNKLTIYNIL
jgi:hypothetical protein